MDDAVTDMCRFIDESPSPYHAAATAADRLDAAGFVRLAEGDAWPSGGRHYIVRGGSLVAWSTVDGTPATAGFRIIGAHTDSPTMRVRPQPERGSAGWSQLRLEVYGSPLLYTWFDRDLGLSGRVAVNDGAEPRLLLVGRPALRLASLAIHLDRGVNERGLIVNAQEHTAAVWALAGPSADGFRSFVAKELEVDAEAVVGWDVMIHDLEPARPLGRDDEFISAPRLDNLCSCWAGLRALIDAEPSATTSVLSLFDHEEVGSASSTGAEGSLLPTVLERIVLAAGGDREAYHRALAASHCVSSDMAHATHPNHADRHEPGHWIAVNGGPVIKSNVNQRYATDAASTGPFLDACRRAGVPHQQYAHRGDLPCGSTIGPATAAALGIPVVDVGAPQLAMHSARELMGAADPDLLARALTAYLG